MAKIITPGIIGYLAGMFDLKGNAYTTKTGLLTAYINGVKDPQMQKDLVAWIGGGAISVQTSEGDRRGCKVHCGHPHIEFRRTSVRYSVGGFRAMCVLYTLEPSMHGWSHRFAEPFNRAMEILEARDVHMDDALVADMRDRGWEIP